MVVDSLVIGVLAIGLVLGLMRGFLSQATGIVGLLGGLWLAARYAGSLQAAALDPWLESRHNGAIAFVSIVVFAVLFAAIVGWAIRKAFEKLELGAYDRLLGGALGLAKAGLICGGVLLGVVYFSPDDGRVERSIGTSRSGPMLWKARRGLAGALPARYRTDAQAFLDKHVPPAPPAAAQTGTRAAE